MKGPRRDDDLHLFRDPADEAPADAAAGPANRVSPPKILSVTGAKGGAGKSVIAANMAVYLASIGRKVVLVDADVVGANLHTMLDVRRPAWAGRRHASGSMLETAVPNLRTLHAGVDEPAAGQSRRTRRAQLRTRLRQLDADFVVVDVGAGLSSTLIDFHLLADMAVYATLPEPTAIDNTYRFLRHAFVRFLRRQVTDPDTRRELVRHIRDMGGSPSPLDLWRRFEDDGDPLADVVREWIEVFNPCLILNQTRLRSDLELGEAVRSAGVRRLGVRIQYLGYIDYDDTVWSCVRNRRSLLIESPGSKSSKSIEKITRRLLAIGASRGPIAWRTVPPESHHDLLEVERGATDEEVRRAYKRVREIYRPDSLCCYGLFEPPELERLQARLEEAFDVLLDPARRRPYELSVFPSEVEPGEGTPDRQSLPAPRPPPPELTPHTDFTGSLLQAVRQSKGVRLHDISRRTKVGLTYLEAIENEDFTLLPAPVYVQGFVAEMAKCLDLDSVQVSRTYVKRYRRFLGERGAYP